LKPRSETIIQTIINSRRNRGSGRNHARNIYWKLLGKPEKDTCPISVINITEEQVIILTPLITIEELPENMIPDTAGKHMMQVT